MPDGPDGEFPYHRIVSELRRSISSGEIAPGARLDSEWELAARFGTSRPTVRRAVAVLKAEGLVVTEQGRGTFAKPRPPVRLVLTGANFRRHRTEGAPGFNAQVSEQGGHPEQRLLEVAELTPPALIEGRLGLGPGARAFVRRRLFLVDGKKVARCDSYYPAELVRNTAISEPRLIRGGALRVIEDELGRTVTRSVDELLCRMPTADEASALGLAAGSPVVQVLRTVFDADGSPVEVQDTVAAAEHHTFRYEVELR